MENQQIYSKPVTLSFTLLIPKAKKLASQTGAKMRLDSDKESFGGHLIACQGTTGTLGFLLHLCQGPHCLSGVGSLGMRKQLPSLQAALSKLSTAAPAGSGRPTSPCSGELGLSSSRLTCPVPGQPGPTHASSRGC